MPTKVLVTGGAGYVGSVLSQKLAELGCEVTIFDRLDFGVDSIIHLLTVSAPGKIQCIRADIRNKEFLAREMTRNDVILHLAALVGFPACAADPQQATEVNVGGSRNIAELVSKDQIFVYASTGSTYGLVNGVCTEETPISPLSHYGRTKAEAEKICQAAGAVCLRFATVFGASPCIRFDLLVNNFVWQAVHRKYLVMYEGNHKRTFIHAVDAAESYILAMKNSTPSEMGGKVFNVGSNDLNLTKREVAEAINQIYPVYIHEASVGKDADCRNYCVDYSKLAAYGFKATVGLAQGIREVGEIAKLVNVSNRLRTE